MKKLLIILIILPIFTKAQSWKDLKKAAEKVNTELIKGNAFSEEEAVNALKETLNKGTKKGVSVLSVKDGYFGNQKVKIPFPKNATKVAEKLKQLGMQKQVDEVVLSINRAAEDAAIAAKPIFVDAIKKMSIKDAIGIVRGEKTAGTDYLNRNTNIALVSAFKPIIKRSLDKVNATKYWKSIMTTYNKIPFAEKVNPELETYVTEKAISGLFFMLAQQEIAIRENPKERTTALLKKVFGN
jgi:nitrogen regulatory protein PII